MAFLKLFHCILLFVSFQFGVTAQAEFQRGDLSLQVGAGPHETFSYENEGHLKFDVSELHYTFDKQLMPTDTTVQNSALKHTDSWTGGFEQELTEALNISLDYDSLSDEDEQLFTDGAKVTLGLSKAHLSYRYARSKIDKDFNIAGPRKPPNYKHGAFLYQSTFETGMDIDIGEQDTLTPSISYSFFAPDVDNFVQLLSKKFATNISSFTKDLQNLEQWSVGADYHHVISDAYTADFIATVAHLIIGNNPSIALNPTLERKWNEHLSNQLGILYTYIPGSPTWIGTLQLKYSFGNPENTP